MNTGVRIWCITYARSWNFSFRIQTREMGPKKRASAAKPAAKPASKARSRAASKASDCGREFFEGLLDHDFFGDKVQHAYLYGVVDEESVAALKGGILEMNKSVESHDGVSSAPKPIVVHVNSPGGSASDAMRMRTVFRESRVPICTLVDGMSCSAATFLSVLAPYRVMCEYASTLIHEYSSVMYGKRDEILYDVETAEGILRDVRDAYLSHTKFKAAQLDALLKRDLYLSADTCAKNGVCDRVIRPSWKGCAAYMRKNPQYNLGYAAMLKKTNLNNISLQCDGMYNLPDVLAIDRVLQAPAASVPFVKPVTIHIDKQGCNASILYQTIPLLHRIQALQIPSVALVSAVVSLEDFLPAFFCTRRVMFEHAKLCINVVSVQQRSALLQDVVDNTRYVFGILGMLLKKHSRLPDSVLKALDRERVFLSASECKKYGLVDEVIKL